MAKVTYKSYNQNDSLLFPHCIGDFIPENDPVRVLDAIVEHLDIISQQLAIKFEDRYYLLRFVIFTPINRNLMEKSL